MIISFSQIKQHIIHKLEKGLSPALTYHNLAHTLDVMNQAIDIAEMEGLKDENDLLLLKISALYHDVGFLQVYTGHEEISCSVASEELYGFGFSKDEIDIICGMIRSTKVPQEPKTKLEEIICDADLDYLGREDFFQTGEGLYKEFINQKIVFDERSWNSLQERFLESHQYFTNTSIQRRQKQKQMNLEMIKGKLI